MTDPTPDIIEQGRAALVAHGLAENDGDDYVLDGVYVTGAVTVIAEAVAPLIAAQALRDAADAWQTGGWSDSMPHGASRTSLILGMAQRATTWLRARADEIERGES